MRPTPVVLLLAFLIGVLAGLRTFTAPAVTAWAAYLGWIRLEGALSFMGSTPAVALFSLAAIIEYIADKLPKMHDRTVSGGLIARVLSAGLTGACVAAAGVQPALLGAVLGAAGGVTGCFAGFHARTKLVKALRVPDIYVALPEDLIALGGSLLVITLASP
ncbi:MAG: DUF4126 family protein [Longimicrobiales bacterium]